MAPERIWKWEHTSGAKHRNFFPFPATFSSLQVQFVVLVGAFVTVSTVWSVSCLLFFYSRRPPVLSYMYKWRSRVHVPYGVDATTYTHKKMLFIIVQQGALPNMTMSQTSPPSDTASVTDSWWSLRSCDGPRTLRLWRRTDACSDTTTTNVHYYIFICFSWSVIVSVTW